ncbi:MAG: TonB-dependent receptor [Bacteroidota bacterium]
MFRLSDVVITGTRTAMPIEKLSTSVQIVDSLELAQSNGISLADKLKNLSGVTLRGYGGNGALQSVSIRGMGSDYALILIDGQRFTTFQISTVDVGIFSLAEVERIEISGGGNSSLYGADAVGGVINIITKKATGKYFALLSNNVGSFGLIGYQLTAGGGNERFSYRGTMKHQHASNAFEFVFDDGITQQTLQRSGSDYFIKNYSLSARTSFSDNIITNYSFRYSEAERGQPSAVTNAVQNNLARIHDKDVFLNSTTEMSNSQNITLSIPITYHFNQQNYGDPNLVISGIPLSAYYENNIINISPILRYSFSSDHLLMVGSDLTVASISSNESIPSKREQLSGLISSQHHFQIPFEATLYPSIRFDSFSDTQGDISPKIGVNIGVLEEPVLHLRASYGKNYRVPTFNDLYWVNGGNPQLHPERSWNFDAGFIGGIQHEIIDFSVEANYFSIDARDKIVWQPVAGGIWSPKNLQSVSSSGVELRVNANMFNHLLMLNYHHNFLRTIKTSADTPNDITQNKILPFVPQEISSLIIGSSYAGVSLNILYSFNGFRYETADNNPRFILPTYETVDVNLSYEFSFASYSFRIRGEVNNILNTEYQQIRGYPTPLRNYLITTEFSFQ